MQFDGEMEKFTEYDIAPFGGRREMDHNLKPYDNILQYTALVLNAISLYNRKFERYSIL